MPDKPVLGSAPIDITDPATGRQYSIPLRSLYFDGSTGQIKADHWPEYGAGSPGFKSAVDGWLGYLVKQSLLVSGTAPPPQPAFSIKARDTGSTGNFVTVKFESIVVDKNTPGNTTADVTVTETDTYTGLTAATVGNVIGTSAGGGSQPGLVFVASNNPTLPGAASGGKLQSAGVGKPFQFDFGGAFTVQAKRDDPEAANTQVDVKDIDTNAKTFTLTAVWQKKASGVKLSDLNTKFGYEIVVTAPAGGFAPPAQGTVTLTGGSDAMAAAAAQATVVSGS
jgi:hypothetical protein